MEVENMKISKEPRISSTEIAEVCEMDHLFVLKYIDMILKEDERLEHHAEPNYETAYKTITEEVEYCEYFCTKKMALIIAAGCYKIRSLNIYDRFEELEAKEIPPTTFAALHGEKSEDW